MVAFTIAAPHKSLVISLLTLPCWWPSHSADWLLRRSLRAWLVNFSSALLEDTLLLGEWVHALVCGRLSPRTVERHCLEHRNAHGGSVEMSC